MSGWTVNSGAWHRAFSPPQRTHPAEALEVEGTLPDGLRGTLYRNGPGSFGVGGEPFHHWFDGDGMIHAVHLDGRGGATGSVRFVETAERAEEQAAGRIRFSGFGTRGPWLRAVQGRVKNAANTSVIGWQGRLLCLWEGGLPTELDPETLACLGTSDLDGVISSTFTAHPHRVPGRKETWAFGVNLGRRSFLELHVLPDSGPARRAGRIELDFPTMVHDFICTEEHLIFLLAPLKLDVLRQVLGLGAFADNLRWRPDLGSTVLIVPMDDPSQARKLQTDACFAWHFANAFEDAAGRLVVDLVRYPDWSTNGWLVALARDAPRGPAQGAAWRLEIDGNAVSWSERWSGSCEFPRIDPRLAGREARHAWMCAHDDDADRTQYFTRLVRMDLVSGEVVDLGLEPGRYATEPVFVPAARDAAEGEGWVLSTIYDTPTHRSFVGIWDSRGGGAGPVARC